MPNEPVQVVTNPEQLRTDRETQRPNKAGRDFYDGDDSGFARHRDALAEALRALLRASSQDAATGGLVYAKVTMAERAIAKSHRPQKRLFKPDQAPHIATAGIGEPIYALTPGILGELVELVASAPVTVPKRVNNETGAEEPNPSRLRCELSAIASIDLWGPADKRDFSAAEGAAWMRSSGSGASYVVELFPLAAASRNRELDNAQRICARDLEAQLSRLAVDAQARPYQGVSNGRTLLLRVLDGDGPSRLQLGMLSREVGTRLVPAGAVSSDDDRHEVVLRTLGANPLVRAIHLPPRPRYANPQRSGSGSLTVADLPGRGDGQFSTVGVIDGGVSDVLGDWIAHRWGQLADVDRDDSHGTFISGLLVAADDLNPTLAAGSPTGCNIVDIDVLPADPGGTYGPFDTYYPGGVADFLDEVEEAVQDARERLGVRVFNFSMNFEAPGDSLRYGLTARRLDEIARQMDVLFVISAGNLHPNDQRTEWHSDPRLALTAFVSDGATTIAEPAESLFNISVAALNPSGLVGQVAGALARYSRRGPGLRGATKPDLAHVGGSGTTDPASGTGLWSIDPAGDMTDGAGTSYAAPLVARQLADLDALVEGNTSREVLLGMLFHYAATPTVMKHRTILPIARDLVGWGVPSAADQMLERPDSEIVLVVNSVVLPREQHTLVFDWPDSLVRDGKCRGYARLTLVARPVLAYEHGDERIRVNIDAKLMQGKAEGGFESALKPTNRPATQHLPRSEQELLAEALKWQAVKSFDGNFRGRGGSRTWKLQVEYLTRAEEELPTAGVEFAAILTISDPEGAAPVFQQMRQQLGALGIRTADIRTSIRARSQTGN